MRILRRLKRLGKYLDQRFLGNALSAFLHPTEPDQLIHVNLDVTGSCNLRCQMCSLKAWSSFTAKRLSFEQLTRLDTLFSQIRSIDVHCNCEPLLHPELVEIIRHIKAANPQLFVAFVTNGTLLTPSVSRRLVESGLDKIGFSIDGACIETYETIRQGARFEQVLSNIRQFFEIKRTLHAALPTVEFISVVLQNNLAELPQILSLGAELGIDTYSVNGLEPYTKEMAAQIIYGEEPSLQAQQVFAELRHLAGKYGIYLLLPHLTIQPYTTCVLQSCVIDVDGEVHPCPALSYARPYYYAGEYLTHPCVSFGNAFEQDILDIWHSARYRTFRKKLRQGHLPPYCQRCLMQHKVLCPTLSNP